MNENLPTIPEEEKKNIVKQDESKTSISVNVHNEMMKLIPLAGTIELNQIQRDILFSPVKEEDIEIRADGLVYLPWPFYVERLNKAFGISWCIIPKDMPKLQQNHMYWPFYLMIQGKLAGFAIGEQEYQPNNPQMSYSDASEGAKSNALMRLCKGLGISLELWKPSFIRAWKEKYAECYPATWPDGRPKLDRNGRQKMEWKRKDRKEVEEIVEVEEVVKKENDVEQLKKESEVKFVEYHERMMAIENIFELRNWYKKHYQEMKNTLLPEHWNMIVELKDSLKKKFEEENSINDGRIE
jgi:hypothetical protein